MSREGGIEVVVEELSTRMVKLGHNVTAPSNPDTVNVFPKVPFSVKVIISDLNYRREPKMGKNVVGQTGIGTFTIVEVKDGWGKLLRQYRLHLRLYNVCD